MSVRSYPKVYNLGHRAIRDLFLGPVAVQEKVDGSQFSFGIIDGEFAARSRNQQIEIDNCPDLFRPSLNMALAAAERGALTPGYVYRGEAMKGARHNVLTYERAPAGNFVLFDVDAGLEDRVGPYPLCGMAADLGCECVPLHYVGDVSDLEEIKALVQQGSFLGGNMEGLVFKNYNRFNEQDGKMLMGKYVTDQFREKHAKDPNWKPKTKNDILNQIGEIYCTEARWQKAIQHQSEAGALTGSPADIGPLIKEIQNDILEECNEEIAQMFMDYYAKQLRGSFIRGFPEWYKNRLAEIQFAPEDA